MPWVDGEPLDRHIAALVKTDPKRLHLVAYKFSVMASWLVNQPFAHGDIKPDNILVRADGAMVLVDYDGLFVPSMLGTPSREAGTPAFRHPNRPTMPFDERIDDFPLASINLSLYLIALKPGLLQKYGAKDRLLFAEADYVNIAQCSVVKEISKLNYDPHLQRLYALFLIALSEGCLERCENRLMLLPPPREDFKIEKCSAPQINKSAKKTPRSHKQVQSSKSFVLDFNVNGVQFRMKYVEGGTFMMGAPGDDSEATDSERPRHSVTLDNYYIASTQVTQELWQAVMGSNPSFFEGDIHRPVEMVSWNDCQEFIEKLSTITGRTFSLPTEAQWEYAARGGKKSKGYKFSGSNNLGDVAWYGGNSNNTTHPVAQKHANELGLYDMTGNVREWCLDRYDSNYYASSPQNNPQGPSSGGNRVLRGGSWLDDPGCCRVSYRGDYDPGDRDCIIGFRLSLPV